LWFRVDISYTLYLTQHGKKRCEAEEEENVNLFVQINGM